MSRLRSYHKDQISQGVTPHSRYKALITSLSTISHPDTNKCCDAQAGTGRVRPRGGLSRGGFPRPRGADLPNTEHQHSPPSLPTFPNPPSQALLRKIKFADWKKISDFAFVTTHLSQNTRQSMYIASGSAIEQRMWSFNSCVFSD